MNSNIEAFREYLKTKNKTDNVIEFHISIITPFLKWLQDQNQINNNLIRDYIISIEARKSGESKYARAIIKNFYLEVYTPPQPKKIEPVNNVPFIEAVVKRLRHLNYSERTITNYVSALNRLSGFLECPFDQINDTRLQEYFSYVVDIKKYKGSTMNILISAIKMLYLHALKRPFDFTLTQRPRRSKYLPVVLNPTEVKEVLSAITNTKHNTCISLMYATGMRVSEVANLKVSDIDRTRRTIHIKNAKGQKDRIVVIPQSLLPLVLIEMEDSSSKDFVFKSAQGGGLSTRTISAIVTQATAKTSIKKNVSPHTFRHSFATHLLEKGVNLRYIQQLMGHSDINTTTRYTKVANSSLVEIPELL